MKVLLYVASAGLALHGLLDGRWAVGAAGMTITPFCSPRRSWRSTEPSRSGVRSSTL
ncbi:MAG TPA: hypothetical protein VD969_09555 [Symbiobacteriaceae bacterium]|nr:hypothetical protein [Symbiobacteriaceae bacterium]